MAMPVPDTATKFDGGKPKETTMHRHPKTRLEALASLAPFASCTRRELAIADSLMTTTVARPGQVLARQGDVGRQCFLVESGTVTVMCDGVVVGEAGPGSWLGEMALLDGTPRTATLTAQGPVVLGVLNPREFGTLLVDLPDVADTIRRLARARQEVLTRQRPPVPAPAPALRLVAQAV
jgi:CRP-like cAMP-binding protein